jgi:hypothetical protein
MTRKGTLVIWTVVVMSEPSPGPYLLDRIRHRQGAAAGDGARRVRIDAQAQKLIAVPRSISQESTRLASTPTAAGTGMLKPKAETLP